MFHARLVSPPKIFPLKSEQFSLCILYSAALDFSGGRIIMHGEN